ncbi:sensor histidine kinase [Streptosporangium sp. 'caverna']|uniref:sensor histidine kinase n=1 Tax=Streptosporangium sp. 'caverna' TaxID=2202249 RepID=UPI000D7E106B|nr:sensor histidine kinase [Streptosporangium sp. 'caverna']AWS46326.1 two-component sensor histidine kinase [Streptosporangium sp. 'caverna']
MEWARRLGGRGVADAAVAVVLALFVGYAIVDPPGPSSSWPPWSAWPVAAVVSFPVAARRRWPRAMLGLACAAGVLATVAGAIAPSTIWLSFVPTVLVLYLVASTTSVGWSVAGLAVCAFAAVTVVLIFYAQVLPGLTPAAAPSELPPHWPVEIGVISVLLTAGWAVGTVVRWKRDTTARLVRHLAEAAVTDERRRIARELHDVIGHSMSLIAVKATVANHVADARPQEARAALAVIEQTSRSTLAEIHRVLGLLRSDGDLQEAPLPAPGMADLPELAADARSAGIEVDLTVREEAALPPAVAVSVYRIVQQALTNIITHAGPTRCSVTVDIDGRAAVIEVIDDGPRHGRPPRPGHGGHGGHGLIGMRERAKMYGGTFSAESRPEGGFRVAARLPYDPDGAVT